MKIKSATFLSSAHNISQCPQSDLPEYAFIGRSNVGKSSLINMLTARKKLAKTSSTPGKTRLINHFNIDDTWLLADLPGYGYAKVSKTQRENLARLIERYATTRSNLVCFCVLIDSRIPPQKIDLDFIQWVGENNLPFVIIYTKIDKVSQKEKSRTITQMHKELSEYWEEMPLMLETSAIKGTGREELLNFIDDTNKKMAT